MKKVHYLLILSIGLMALLMACPDSMPDPYKGLTKQLVDAHKNLTVATTQMEVERAPTYLEKDYKE